MLTDAAIKNAMPNQDKPYKLSDVRALYVLVHPNGSKYFRLDYRFGDKRKTLSIGIYPEVTLKKAREKAAIARLQIGEGIDPNQSKQDTKQHILNQQKNTFRLVFERWLQINQDWGEKYRQDVAARALIHLIPFIGDLLIDEISRDDLIKIIDRLKLKKMHSASIGKLHGYLSATFRYAIAEGTCLRNVAEDIKPLLPTNSPTKHRAALTEEQLPDFLRKLDAYQGRYETITALRLLLWTATRPKETFAAKWEEFDLNAGLWALPIERMKKKRLHVIPLQTQAVNALTELQSVTGHNVYLFPNQQTANTHMSENTLNVAIQKGLGFDCTAHGMRSTFSTIMNTFPNSRADVIEVSLAHIDSTVRGIYNRADYMVARREMMQQWADYLDSIKAGA